MSQKKMWITPVFSVCVCGGGGGVRGGGWYVGGGVGVGGCFALGIWIRKRNGIAMDGWRFMNKSPTRLCLAQQQQQITRWPSLASSRLTGCGKTWFGLIKNKNVGSTPTCSFGSDPSLLLILSQLNSSLFSNISRPIRSRIRAVVRQKVVVGIIGCAELSGVTFGNCRQTDTAIIRRTIPGGSTRGSNCAICLLSLCRVASSLVHFPLVESP